VKRRFELDTSRIVKLTTRVFLISAIAVLICNVLAISRDYQDSWVLEGLEIPFLLFAVALALTFFSEKRISALVVIAIVSRIVFLLIPNLKYVWFQGVYIDQHQQYNLASYVVATGRILPGPISASFTFYALSPLLHLLFSIFSIVLNVPVVNSMKYVPVLFSPIYPLITYAIMKKMELTQESSITKYALFLSGIPIARSDYIIGGITFGILLAFIILFLLVAILRKNDRRYWFVCLIFVIALAAAHSATSIILTGLLLLILTLKRVPYFRSKSYLRASVVLTVALVSLTWLMFQAYFNFEIIVRAFSAMVPTGTTPPSDYIPSTFFQLARVEPLAAAETFLVFFGTHLFLLILALAGLAIMSKMSKTLNNASSFLMFLLVLTVAIIILGVFIRLGPTRALPFDELLFPIFCGTAVFYLGRKRKWIRALLFASIMLLATVQFYGCQPLIPPANLIYAGLPASVPIGYVNNVNSIFQRRVVSFALSHVVVGVVASDPTTYNQMLGVADFSFMSLHFINYYPIDTQEPQQRYDLLIIHVPGKAGILEEKANLRTPDLILQTVYNSDVVYTNGESYMLAHYPQP
jgi:hypothetical protein